MSVITAFTQRTIQGAEALMGGLRAVAGIPASEQPTTPEWERIAFLAVGESVAWSRLFGWERLDRALTPMVAPTLAASVFRQPQSRPTGYLAAGLLASSTAQCVKQARLTAPSILGVAGVAGQYAGYSSALCHAGARPTKTMLAAGGAAVAAGTLAAAKLSPRHVPAVLVGGTFAALNSALADDPSFRATSAPISAKGISHGANLLLGSEALTFTRALTTPGTWAYRLTGAAEAATFYLGSFLLFEGLTRR